MAPREKITGDFQLLADRLLGVTMREPVKAGLNLFGRRSAARA